MFTNVFFFKKSKAVKLSAHENSTLLNFHFIGNIVTGLLAG